MRLKLVYIYPRFILSIYILIRNMLLNPILSVSPGSGLVKVYVRSCSSVWHNAGVRARGLLSRSNKINKN